MSDEAGTRDVPEAAGAVGMDAQGAAVIMQQARERAGSELRVRRPVLFVTDPNFDLARTTAVIKALPGIMRPVEILLAKIIPYFGIGMIGLLLCLVAARYLFVVPMYGSLAILVGSAMLYLIVAVGLGLVISSVTRNQFLASQVALISSFLPSMMLSGFLFDLRNVPTAIRVVGQVLPATYFMELIRSLFLAGNVWPLILRNCTILAFYAVLLLAVARFVTRKKLD